jgi:hypothetical protein
MRFKKTLIGAVLALIAPLLMAAPAHASTQYVRFGVWDFHCQRGVYDVVHVEITSPDMYSQIHGTWTGSANPATVEIQAVPASGHKVNVVIDYRCKTAWGGWPGFGTTSVPGTAWVYGSGWQPLWRY